MHYVSSSYRSPSEPFRAAMATCRRCCLVSACTLPALPGMTPMASEGEQGRGCLHGKSWHLEDLPFCPPPTMLLIPWQQAQYKSPSEQYLSYTTVRLWPPTPSVMVETKSLLPFQICFETNFEDAHILLLGFSVWDRTRTVIMSRCLHLSPCCKKCHPLIHTHQVAQRHIRSQDCLLFSIFIYCGRLVNFQVGADKQDTNWPSSHNWTGHLNCKCCFQGAWQYIQ